MIMAEPPKNEKNEPLGPYPHDKVKLDFMARMALGEVENFYEYYLLAQNESLKAGVFVAKHTQALC